MILVTGATGTVGSHVVRELRSRGARVRGFVRDPDAARGKLGGGIELAAGDFADPDSLRRAVDGTEAVFLAAANDPRQVEYETNLIDAARQARVRAIVKLSAAIAEPGSPLEFGDWHGRIERHLATSGVPAVILRPSFFMSNLLASAGQIAVDGKLRAPAGAAEIAMIDPSDVAAAAAVVLTEDGHLGRTYPLTGPAALGYRQIADQLSAATGRAVEFVDLPDDAARRGLLDAGMPDWLAEHLITLFGILREGPAEPVSRAVRDLTGREPTSFAQFARDHAEAFGSVS